MPTSLVLSVLATNLAYVGQPKQGRNESLEWGLAVLCIRHDFTQNAYTNVLESTGSQASMLHKTS